MKILLIDYDETGRQVWQDRFQALGVEATVVRSRSEFKEAAKESRFAIGVYRLSDSDPDGYIQLDSEQINRCCYWSFAVVKEINGSVLETVFRKGFRDCLTDDCAESFIAARLKHARHLQQSDHRLTQAQKLESIGELAAGIAHEINTPIQYVGDNTRFVQEACGDLTAVLQCCQSLISAAASGGDMSKATQSLRTSMDDADVEYLIEEIPSAITQTLEGVDRVSKIVRAMKDFAHPGVSEMTLTDLSHSINNTVMVARNEWKYAADLVTDFDPNLPPVPCLPGEMNQVLLNMIVNASHAISDALGDSPQTKGTITISTRISSPYAEIRVSDTGSGISPENVERIFNPFFTTKAAGKGTGQGLAIAQSVIVEKHGGTIKVESELGKGTTFVIRIPLENSPKSDGLSSASNQLVTA